MALNGSDSKMAYYADAKSLGNRLRGRRARKFLDPLLENLHARRGSISVVDLGGTELYWTRLGDRLERFNISVTLVNMRPQTVTHPRFTSIAGSATRTDFGDNTFDLVHSNSTIEHVGQWPDMRDMAREVRRLAPVYYVQVPNFWFPVEPHFRSVFFHYLPEQIRARMLMRWRLGFHGPCPTLDDAMRHVQSSKLLDSAQLRALFPDAKIMGERVFGLVKSLIAIRT